ncbi:hypothetical protein GGS21DRAFT_520058, partial [Xylaria nigripes]
MRWLLRSIARSAVRPLRLRPEAKFLSTVATTLDNVERISVPVGSSGSVQIDWHNQASVPSLEPLLIYLPPLPTVLGPASDRTYIPKFALGTPTAVIHYRGASESVTSVPGAPAETSRHSPHSCWPTPIHDIAQAYTYITRTLTPADGKRRDIYVCGSYLGASLAISLALTETYPSKSISIRGCIAHNGIYEWTKFLQDHPSNENIQMQLYHTWGNLLMPKSGSAQKLKDIISATFKKPTDLFDPFASPFLFFSTPGFLTPPSFDANPLLSSFDEEEWAEDTEVLRQARLQFPPHQSFLSIPEILFIHGTSSKFHDDFDIFETQAEALAKHMRRSFALNERKFAGGNWSGWEDDVDKRVQVHSATHSGDHNGDQIAAEWFKARELPRVWSLKKDGFKPFPMDEEDEETMSFWYNRNARRIWELKQIHLWFLEERQLIEEGQLLQEVQLLQEGVDSKVTDESTHHTSTNLAPRNHSEHKTEDGIDDKI